MSSVHCPGEQTSPELSIETVAKGVCATDEYARALDDGCKLCAQEVLTELVAKFGSDLTFKKKLEKSGKPQATKKKIKKIVKTKSSKIQFTFSTLYPN